ncbi:MAG: uL15m family ribosomal protein [Candidatus Pacearchaeota archaeon]
MKLKKRNKRSRIRGRKFCGYAAKKHKGSGNRGGKGMAGSGYQKKSYVIRYLWPYFGKAGERKEKVKNYKEINVEDIEKKLEGFKKEGVVKEGKEGLEISLDNYKVLGDGEITKKIIVKAKAFTNSAKEKIEKVGGKAVVLTKEKKRKKDEPTKEKIEIKEKIEKKLEKEAKEEEKGREKKIKVKKGKILVKKK